jgi:hypothetical protein
VHVKMVCRFHVRIRVVMCTFVIWENYSIGCVGASVSTVHHKCCILHYGHESGTFVLSGRPAIVPS